MVAISMHCQKSCLGLSELDAFPSCTAAPAIRELVILASQSEAFQCEEKARIGGSNACYCSLAMEPWASYLTSLNLSLYCIKWA